MLKNYLKTSLRNIMTNKVYSIINISGLAVGMAGCILIMMWVQSQLSFDRFYNNLDDIYGTVTTKDCDSCTEEKIIYNTNDSIIPDKCNKCVYKYMN